MRGIYFCTTLTVIADPQQIKARRQGASTFCCMPARIPVNTCSAPHPLNVLYVGQAKKPNFWHDSSGRLVAHLRAGPGLGALLAHHLLLDVRQQALVALRHGRCHCVVAAPPSHALHNHSHLRKVRNKSGTMLHARPPLQHYLRSSTELHWALPPMVLSMLGRTFHRQKSTACQSTHNCETQLTSLIGLSLQGHHAILMLYKVHEQDISSAVLATCEGGSTSLCSTLSLNLFLESSLHSSRPSKMGRRCCSRTSVGSLMAHT